jgi:hypothetical protein
MKILLSIIVSSLIFSSSLLAIHFSDEVTLDQIRVVETERLRISLFLKYEDSRALNFMVQQNIYQQYLEPFLNEPIEWNDQLVRQFVGQIFDVNKKALSCFDSNLRIISPIKSMNYLIRFKDSDEIIGMIEVSGTVGLESTLGIFIAQTHSKKGYATEAVKGILKMLEEKSQMAYCTWQCWQDNLASRRVAKLCEFEWVEDCWQENGPVLSIFQKSLSH